ncbi:hypothetical protein PybrP1_008054 [[Pythium] brassicae (nom. inval.)]|nr:hypothetical protein PybrP1_008054 [[Pythium] brassicae (nom. inval.)]
MNGREFETESADTFNAAPPATSVLSDAALFGLITDFQSGYPRAVAAVATARPNWAELKRVSGAKSHQSDGLLPRLAVAAGDAHALRTLFDLRRRPQYRDDARVRFTDALLTAIRLKRVDMLECVAQLLARDPDWRWKPGSLALALTHGGGDVRVLEWLYRHLPADMRALRPHDMVAFARRGDLEVVRWLHEHGCEVVPYIANVAASSWNANLVAYLYQHTAVRCSPDGIVGAAANGTLETVRIVTVEQAEGTYERALNAAARRGRLDVVRHFVESRLGVGSPTAIDEAAWGGSLPVVQYLHARLAGGCTPAAMDAAAAGGHLDIVKFLHAHRAEGCTARALETAARQQHLEVVEFLCEHRREGDVGAAVVSAASDDNLPLVKILHRHLRARDAAYQAARAAALARNAVIVKFLCENQDAAAAAAHRAAAADEAGNRNDDDAPPSFLVQALRERTDWMVRAVSPFSSMAELTQAKAVAIEREREPQIIQILERFIQKLACAAVAVQA